MRLIPAALLAKLSERWQADATDSKPNLKLIATQSSVNTLITEPIHSGIAAAYGDVALRQLPGETTPSYAYAICLDDGIAKVYGRALPADYEQAWTYLWTLGAAEDVAIEYNGTWQLTGNDDFYTLITEETPWIFWVVGGTLYAQKWSDNSTMLTLATGVSQISVCRAWQSTIDTTLDQGVVAAYIKNGAVYYRSYCFETNGSMVWEPEQVISELGTGILTLQVFRTNDFRTGFMIENAAGMTWALSDRVYSGLSFRPETIDVQIQSPIFHVVEIQTRGLDIIEEGSTTPLLNLFFFAQLPSDGSSDLTMTVVRVGTTQFKLSFNKTLIDWENLMSHIMISPVRTITAQSWNPVDKSLLITIGLEIKRNIAVTIVVNESRDTSFFAFQEQIIPFIAVTTVIAAEITTTTNNDETATVSVINAQFSTLDITTHQTILTETSVVGILDPVMELHPVSTLPI
jgi:hypothetical protein